MNWRYLVQRLLGGVQRVPNAGARVALGRGKESGKCHLGITAECLHALFDGRAPVLVFRSAVPTDLCEVASARLEALAAGANDATSCSRHFAPWYLGVDPDAPPSDYTKVGYTKTDVMREELYRMAAGRAASERYLSCASETQDLLNSEIFAPHRCPIEDIRDELAALPGVDCRTELCPTTGRPFLPCVVRRMLPGGRRTTGNIHMDVVLPGRTFSINVYLRVPKCDSGGELVLYPVRKDYISRLLNSHFFATLEVQNFYPGETFYPERLLTSGFVEPIVHRPEVGDVIIIDPAYPHAVRDFGTSSTSISKPSAEISSRLSLQTFVQSSWSPRWPIDRTRMLEYAT